VTETTEPPELEAEFELGRFSTEEGDLLGRLEFALVVGRFYGDLSERLANSATEAFAGAGVSPASIQTFDVPGAFELPLAAKLAAQSARFAGVCALGAVIRGETDHYDYVCAETARGVQQAALDTGVPCAFGVITCDTMEQALARAGGEGRDTGRGAAQAAMHMAVLARRLD